MIWPAWQYPHWGTSSAIHACCSTCKPFALSPSIVVTLLPPTCDIGVEHDRTALSSTCTVHAPQRPAPQPNFVPGSCSVSRRTQRRGVSGETLTCFSLPFTRSVISAMFALDPVIKSCTHGTQHHQKRNSVKPPSFRTHSRWHGIDSFFKPNHEEHREIARFHLRPQKS